MTRSTSEHLIPNVRWWPAFVGVPRWCRSAVLSIWGTSAATIAFLALLAWLIVETRNGTALGLAERISLTMQTSWPFVVAVTAWHAMHANQQPAPVRSG